MPLRRGIKQDPSWYAYPSAAWAPPSPAMAGHTALPIERGNVFSNWKHMTILPDREAASAEMAISYLGIFTADTRGSTIYPDARFDPGGPLQSRLVSSRRARKGEQETCN
jgi:hypothetical protein